MKNRLKEMLRSGKVTIGGWIMMGHLEVAEIMANSGVDWLVFDNEHGPLTIETTQVLIQAIGDARALDPWISHRRWG